MQRKETINAKEIQKRLLEEIGGAGLDRMG